MADQRTGSSLLRRIYGVIALLSIVHVLALTGMIAFLALSGRLDRDRIERMADVLRGVVPKEAPPENATGGPPAAPQPALSDAAAPPVDTTSEQARMMKELISRRIERKAREVDDRWRQTQDVMVRVIRKQEAYERDRDLLRQQINKLQEGSREEGFTKDVELLSGVPPAAAKDQLMRSNDADAARILRDMDERTRTKIASACKTDEEREWLLRIREKMKALDLETDFLKKDEPAAQP